MKKLVTLSAIALAGATLGVGTTFGWWSDDAAAAVKQSTPTIISLGQDDSLPGSLEINLDTPHPALRVYNQTGGAIVVEEKSQYGKPQAVTGHIRFVQSGGNAPAFEKLADQLEQEAKELEGHGQKEAAAIQRKLAERLRATLKANQAQYKIHKVPGTGGGKLEKGPAEDSDENLKKKLGVLHLDLKKKGEAEVEALTAQIRQIESNLKAEPEAKEKLQHLKELLDQRAEAAARERGADERRRVEHLDRTLAGLREAAERLEQAGRQDEAHAVREQAEHVRRSFEREPGDDRKPKFEKHDIVLDDRPLPDEGPKKIIRFRKEIKEGDGKEGVTIIHVDPKGDRREADEEKEPRKREIPHFGDIPHLKVERVERIEGAPLFEVQKMLKELRHEIQELREEVRGLRGLLGTETRSVKQKVRDEDDDDGEVKKVDPKKGNAKKGDARKGEEKDDDDDDEAKADAKDLKGIVRTRVTKITEDPKRDSGKKSVEERDDDDKPGKGKENDDDDQDDEESEDRQEKDADRGAQLEPTFQFHIGFLR